MKNLPIGINTLKTIIEENMVYVDKTHIAHKLLSSPGRYFLSRPRRFGKSLFLDTLKEIFEGNKELFKGLYIYDNWNWEKKYPVIKIDFAAGGFFSIDLLEQQVKDILKNNSDRLGVPLINSTSHMGIIFKNLIIDTQKKFNSKVVVLIDEYDKPLLDNIDKTEMIIPIRESLKSLYSVIKEQDANLQFVFLTGVSKFSKVSIFSGINNLNDITLDENCATICGYTQNDLETDFAEHLQGVDWDKLKRWYNGYNFLGEKVYNPFDILLFIDKNKTFKNYWFETGSPAFLIKLFQKNKYFLPDLNDIEVGEEILSSFDINNIELTTLLFQTGYLTIKEVINKMERIFYKLSFPNLEVKTAFSEYLIQGYTDITENKFRYEKSTYDALIKVDLPALKTAITRLFAGIPWRNFTNNDLPEFEGYYASVLFAFFSAINCDIIPEDITNHGQADMTVKLGDNIFVMEIKVVRKNETGSPDENNNEALVQIKSRNYAEKYRGIADKKVFEVGMIFSQEKRNLVQFDWLER